MPAPSETLTRRSVLAGACVTCAAAVDRLRHLRPAPRAGTGPRPGSGAGRGARRPPTEGGARPAPRWPRSPTSRSAAASSSATR